MPALQQKFGEIGTNGFLHPEFRMHGDVKENYRALIPAGFGNGAGKISIVKVTQFFDGSSSVSIDSLLRIRRLTATNQPLRYHDLETVFDAYCNQFLARNILYHYNRELSPFDYNFDNMSNCMGRAKGFLQLMAMLGVPKEALAFCQIGGGEGEENCKICQKPDSQIDHTNYRAVPGGPAAPALAPNAVRIVVSNGTLDVQRTIREPFAYHYATRINVLGLGMRFWDPLERCAYRNGFDDAFTSYEEMPSLLKGYRDVEKMGVKVLANPDNLKERLYLLPKAAQRRIPAPPGAYYSQANFVAVENEMLQMTTDPQVIMIVDETDYSPHEPTQPAAWRLMFP